MALYNGQDVQEITTTIGAAELSHDQVVVHNLVDESGNPVSPDTIISEIVGYTLLASTYVCIGKIVRGTGANIGQFTATINTDKVPGGAGNPVKVRYTSLYWAGMYGADRTA